MRLDIDQGNTRIKWRLVSDQAILLREQWANIKVNWAQWLEQIRQFSPDGSLAAVNLATVAKPEFREPLLEFCRQSLGCEPFVAKTQRQFKKAGAQLINSYEDVARMGVDRWLAMVAAVNEFPGRAIVLVDAGSAITVEFIAPSGEHDGGFIVPGLHMMRSSLLSNTGSVRYRDDEISGLLAPGKSTADAVNSGSLASAIGLIAQAHKSADQRWQAEPIKLILSGGDAELLAEHFPAAKIRPDIVLDGLAEVATGGNAL